MYTATISLLVTMLIAHFMLFDALFQGGRLVVHLVILHYVVPLMCLMDWVLFDEKGRMKVWGPLAWLSLVLAYLVIVMVCAGPCSRPSSRWDISSSASTASWAGDAETRRQGGS